MVNLHVHQSVAAERECCCVACAKRHAAQLCSDYTLITDPVAKQCNIATGGRIDPALIDDAAGPRTTEASDIAVESGFIQLQGGGDQTADVQLSPLSKKNTVRVDQINLTIGIEVTKNLCAVDVKDAVDCNSRSRWLLEIYRFLRCYIETFSVKGKLLAGLPDGGGCAGLGDACLA